MLIAARRTVSAPLPTTAMLRTVTTVPRASSVWASPARRRMVRFATRGRRRGRDADTVRRRVVIDSNIAVPGRAGPVTEVPCGVGPFDVAAVRRHDRLHWPPARVPVAQWTERRGSLTPAARSHPPRG